MSINTQYFGLSGGLDLTTPAIQTPAGRAIAGSNYEVHPRGYRRVDGYERLDGRPKPSEASYWVLRFDTGTVEIAADDEVEGGTSGATGTALYDAVLESGTYGGGNAAGYVVLTDVNGDFADGEDLEVSASKVAEADGLASERGASNDTDDSTWYHAAIERRRDAIQAVPGSGPVRGVWAYDGDVYAFRDNAGGTAGVMHKATASGWSAVNLGRELAFTSGGTYEIVEGNTITGATSGATAVITRVAVTSGDWSTGDAAGYLVFASQTGTFQSENLNVGANLNVATIAGNSGANALPPGGRYDFRNHNFFGSSDLLRMYGANGVGNGFEFDGTVLVPIHTGMADDKPTRVEVHRNHLFFSFAGGSLQNSSIGNPYEWQALTGAAEIGLGEDITDLLSAVSGTLAVFGSNKVAVLYGDDSDTWVLKTLSDSSGAVSWTAQLIGTPIYLDSRGLRSMDSTDAFGDFMIGTVTQLVEPIFRTMRRVAVAGGMRVRAKDQYRFFWSDGRGLSVYFGRSPSEILPFDLGLNIACLASGKDGDGDEILLVGDDEGMVYELDAGTSFDGEEVQAYLRLPFNHVGSPAQNKRWTKASLEVDCGPDTTLGLTAEFSYANPDQPLGQEQLFSLSGSGGFWEEMNWDDFYWSSPVEGTAEAPIDGIGRNISIAVISNAVYEAPHILHGLILGFTYRGVTR